MADAQLCAEPKPKALFVTAVGFTVGITRRPHVCFPGHFLRSVSVFSPGRGLSALLDPGPLVCGPLAGEADRVVWVAAGGGLCAHAATQLSSAFSGWQWGWKAADMGGGSGGVRGGGARAQALRDEHCTRPKQGGGGVGLPESPSRGPGPRGKGKSPTAQGGQAEAMPRRQHWGASPLYGTPARRKYLRFYYTGAGKSGRPAGLLWLGQCERQLGKSAFLLDTCHRGPKRSCWGQWRQGLSSPGSADPRGGGAWRVCGTHLEANQPLSMNALTTGPRS